MNTRLTLRRADCKWTTTTFEVTEAGLSLHNGHE